MGDGTHPGLDEHVAGEDKRRIRAYRHRAVCAWVVSQGVSALGEVPRELREERRKLRLGPNQIETYVKICPWVYFTNREAARHEGEQREC